MTHDLRCAIPLLALATFACGGMEGDDAPSDTPETAAERGAFDDGASGVDTSEAALRTADAMFDFDPTLDPAASAAANAENIRAHVASGLSSGCTVALDGTTVTVSFGAAPGCTLAGVTFTGTVVVSVSKSGATTTASVELLDMTVSGTPLSGSATFATTNGSTFQVSASIARDGQTLDANLTVVGTAGAFTADGTVTVGKAGVNTSMTVAGLHYTKGDCYPDAGTVTVRQGNVSQTMTFSADTADSGVVTVTTGRRVSTKTLPAYGACPATAA